MSKYNAAAQLFDKYAQLYQDKYMDLDLYNEGFEFAINAINNSNAKILDVASGPGNISKYLISKQPEYDILGIDLAPTMLQLANVNCPKAVFKRFDCKNISLLKEKYDGIFCGFFLPYLSKEEVRKFIEDTVKQLRKNGILYLSTMEDDYSKSGFKESSTDKNDKIFIYYHQADYLMEFLKVNGFKILQVDRIDFPVEDGADTIDLIIIAQKSF
jgi:2-polyprenyl-3-methyl-5-hydroxy-6-metoxy-1,4-benzoquinol methylase